MSLVSASLSISLPHTHTHTRTTKKTIIFLGSVDAKHICAMHYCLVCVLAYL